MLNNLFIFAVSMFMIIKGGTMATKHAALLATNYKISKYVVGFIVVAVISILPETLIAINSAIKGIPSFGLSTLFGGNVADLTLIFGITVFIAGRGLKVESKILKSQWAYPFLLLFPLILGLDGSYSRLEGLALIVAGIIFYISALKTGISGTLPFRDGIGNYKHALKLIFSMAIMLVGAYFTVSSAVAIANGMGVNPILVGMLIVGLGGTIPELVFAIKCVHSNDDSLAIGDILGTVLADATIVVGILALISPFKFPIHVVTITGAFMVLAAFLQFRFMRSGHTLSKKEAAYLIGFWLIFAYVEFLANT